MSESLSLLCKKAIHSQGSLQKRDPERFAPVAHDKRAMGAIRPFSQANHSFAHKNGAIRSKNRGANPNPVHKQCT